jgi:hypothetical protein
MERLPVTRKVLAREIVVDAAKRPLNIGVGVLVLAAAFALNAVWLLPLAFVLYLAMLVATALDGDRAERVGKRVYDEARGEIPARTDPEVRRGGHLHPGIAERVRVAYRQEDRIRAALAGTPARTEIGIEVDRLMSALDDLAMHANVLYVYLREDDVEDVRVRLERLRGVHTGDATADRANEQAVAALEDQLAARGQIERQLARFDAQIEHIAATLGTIHAQLVRMSAEERAGEQNQLASQVRDLRREIGAAADAMEEAYGDVDSP